MKPGKPSLLLMFAFVFVLLVAGRAPAAAQTTTQGSIIGTTMDPTGAVVPNATIQIVNDATNIKMTISGDSTGSFVAPLLDPGTYTITINAPGFDTYKVRQVVVQVGQATRVAPKLVVGSSESVVEVSADEPIMNFVSPNFSSVIDSAELKNIPINNRRWSALALTTPGVTVDTSGFGLVSVRGLSTILNNVEIDGADDNQAYFSEERGRTREAYSTSASAVREFAMNTGVYPAEYGRAAGGVITSVTNSGTNNLHGQLYFYDRESNWAAYPPQSTTTTVVNGKNVTTPIKPEDVRKIYGFTVGGPLMKNKLFWIYTYDQHAHVFPMLGQPASPANFFQQPDTLGAVGDTACTSTGYLPTSTPGVTSANSSLDQQVCTLAARLSESGRTTYGNHVTYSDGIALYNQGISALNSDLGLIPRVGYQEINTPKIDWQINPKQHFSVLYHRLRWDSPGGVQTTSSGHYSLDSTGTDFVKLDYGVAKLISQVSNSISNELLYQYGRELNDEGMQPTTAYDKANLQTPDGNVPYIALDVSNAGFYVGQPYYAFRPAYPEEWKWQIGDDLYFQHGRHNFKFGVDMVHNSDLTNQAQYYEGYYTYSNNLANYFADLYSKGYGAGTCNSAVSIAATSASASGSAVGQYPCYSNYTQDYGPTTFAFATMDQGYFAQDDWKLSPRLALQLGVRYDYEGIPNTSTNLTAATGSFVPFNGINNNPSDKNNIGPRIGFAYDVFGSGKMVVRGGYGLYYGRITNGNEGVALATTGSPLAQSATKVTSSQGLAAEPVFPYRFSSAQLGSSALPSAYFRAPNLQNPQVHEFDMMVQQQIGKGTVAQVAYLGSLGRELPNFIDVNLNPNKTLVNYTIVDTTGKGPIPNGTVISNVPVFTSYGNTALLGPSAVNFSTVTEMLSNINSSYNALVFEVQNRSLHSLQFDVNYTWAHALDYSQNASTAGNTNNWYDPYSNPQINYGNSTWDIRDRLVAYALYSFPNIHGSSFVKYLTNDWKLDTSFQMQTGLPYSAAVSSGTPSGTSASGASFKAVNSYLNGNGSVNYLPNLGFNNYFYPRDVVADLRVQKNFQFHDRYKLELIGQAFNVANHQNVTEVYGTAYNLSGTTLTYQADWGQAEQTNNSGFSYTPRQIEISTRLSF